MQPQNLNLFQRPTVWATLSGFAVKGVLVLFALSLVIYIGIVCWLHHSISGHAVSIVQAAGAPADAERILRGLLSWLLAAALVPSFVWLILEGLNPLRRGTQLLGKLGLLLLVGFLIALLPHGLRALRGVDTDGLPVKLTASDPGAAQWFAPNGRATLFWSRERDGALRFWSRPGITPDTGIPSQPVTPGFRNEWENQRQRAALESREQARLAAEKAVAELAERQRLLELERRREEEKAAQLRRERAEAIRAERESEAVKLRAEKVKIEADLQKAKAAEQAALATAQREKSAREKLQEATLTVSRALPVTVETPPRPDGKSWWIYQIRTGKYIQLEIPKDTLEIKTANYLEIERPGGKWQKVYPGTTLLSNKAHSLRLHCRTAYGFDIQLRPVP